MRQEKSCGIIPCRDGKYLLVRHTKDIGGHVGFPKGHVEEGETEEETAKREAREEACVDVEIVPGFREEIEYCPRKGVCKSVAYFVGRVVGTGGEKCDDHISDTLWCTYEEAIEIITHDNARGLLMKAHEFLKYKSQGTFTL